MRTPYPVMSAEAYRQRAREGQAPEALVRLPFASEVKAVSRAERTVRFRITTGAPDRMKDTIDPKGWDLKAYRKNPIVLYAHDHRGLPIGKSIGIGADDTGLSSIAQFATKEQYAFADTVYQLILGGFLKATSVGFRPQKHVYNEQRGGVDFLEQELLEYSVVPIPANPEALIEEGYADIVVPRSRDECPRGRACEAVGNTCEATDCPMAGQGGTTPSAQIDALLARARALGWRGEEPAIVLIDDAPEEFVLRLDDEPRVRIDAATFEKAWKQAAAEIVVETYNKLRGRVD